MNNYVYIVSSLPVIASSSRTDSSLDAGQVIEEIKDQLSAGDRETLSLLLDGFDPEKLGAEFYTQVRGNKSAFLKDYFMFDLDVRNAKVRHLNSALGRPEDTDIVSLDEEEHEFDEAAKLQSILSTSDILGREKALDDLMWEKIDSLTTFDYFTFDAILAFVAKLKIVDRWLKLDEARGREMFHKLASEVKATYKGVEFES